MSERYRATLQHRNQLSCYDLAMSRSTVERITALAERASERDRQTILRFAMFSVGLDVDDSPRPSMVGPEELAKSVEALEDLDAGNGVPYEDVRDRIDRKLARHGA